MLFRSDLVRHGLAAAPGRHEPIALKAIGGDDHSSGFDREQQNRLKQEAFYKTGTRFFNLKGFKGTSLDEIAEELQVTKGAFYYHIRNKEDLLYQCYQRSISIMGDIAQQAAQQPDGLSRVEYHCRQSFVVQNSDAGPPIRYTSVTSLPLDRRKEVLDQTDRGNALLGRFIADGIADGSIRTADAMVAGELIAGAVNASMELDKWRSVEAVEQASVDYFNLLINGLAPRD